MIKEVKSLVKESEELGKIIERNRVIKILLKESEGNITTYERRLIQRIVDKVDE